MLENINLQQLNQIGVSGQQNSFIDNGGFAAAEKLLRNWLPLHQGERNRHIVELELGRLLLWRGKPTEAKNQLERTLQLNPRESWTYSMLAQVEARLGEYEKAEELFKKALELDPNNHEANRFLRGDSLDQMNEVKRLLTHGKLSPRDRIKAAELCSAIDFRRRRHINMEKGDLTQPAFARSNMMLDAANVGEEVDSEMSLRNKFNQAEEVVFYTSCAFGDAILGVGAFSKAVARYFEAHPERRKLVEIVTPFADEFEGLSEKYPFLRIKKLGKSRDPHEAEIYANDLRGRQKKVFAMTNSGTEIYNALDNARTEKTLAIVDSFVDRFSRDLPSWQTISSPYDKINSYPSKMYRFIEMLVGEKLVNYPASITSDIPVSNKMRQKGQALMRQYGLKPGEFHCVNEACSQISKSFSPEQLREILIGMVNQCREEERRDGGNRKIVFFKDPGNANSFANEINRLPPEIRQKIVVILEDFTGVGGLVSNAKTILSPDTGIAHLASALGKKTTIISTMADPYLWNTGGNNVEFLASPQALAAHDNLTPVNMIEWNSQEPITQKYFSAQEILGKWRALSEKRILGQP